MFTPKECKPLINHKSQESITSLTSEKSNVLELFHSSDDLCDHIQHLVFDHLALGFHNNQPQVSIEIHTIDRLIAKLKDVLHTYKQKQLRGPSDKRLKITKNRNGQNYITTPKSSLSIPTQTSRLDDPRELCKQLSLREDPQYTVDSDKFCGCQGSVRQDWNTVELDDEQSNWKELKPCFFELFFDLMFVASIVHISSEAVHVYDNHTGQSGYLFILQVFAQFGIFVLCWIEQVLYQSRFRMHQGLDNILRFIYMALVLTMGLGISDNEISHKSFLVSYVCIKFVLILMLIKSALIPRARNHSLFMISEKVISIVATLCILVLVSDVSDTIWLIIFASLFVYSYIHIIVLVYCDCVRYVGVNIPINVPHVAERMGAFVLIVLGETIISIMVQHFDANPEEMILAYTVTMSFFLIVYCSGKLYFGSQPTEHEVMNKAQSHALSSDMVWRARVYCAAHFMFFFGLLGLGIGAKMVTHELSNHHDMSMEVIFLPGVSCIVILVTINVIRVTHPIDYSEYNTALCVSMWSVRALSIGLMCGILFAWNSIDQYIILIVYVICFFLQLVIEFEKRDHEKLDPHGPHSLKLQPYVSTSLTHQTSGML